MAKITEQQRRWWHHEFEDLKFEDDLVTGEVAVAGPLDLYRDSKLTPDLVLEITLIQEDKEGGYTIEGEAADSRYSEEQRKELLKMLEDKWEDEAIDYLERHQYDR